MPRRNGRRGLRPCPGRRPAAGCGAGGKRFACTERHVAVAAGLAALFAAVPVAFTVVRIVGAAYLIYLGVQAIRKRGTIADEEHTTGVPGRRAYLSGLLTNLLNPKVVTFTIAFLPQFIDPALGRVWLQFVILGAIMIAFEFIVDGTVGVLAGRIGGWLRRKHAARRRIEVTSGGIFIGLGIRLAVDH